MSAEGAVAVEDPTSVPDGRPPSDDDIRAAVEATELWPLLAAAAHATGDLSLVSEDLRADPRRAFEPGRGVDPVAAAAARTMVGDALVRWRRRGSPAPAPPTADDLATLLSFLTRPDPSPTLLTLLAEEIALDGHDPRAPAWHRSQIAPDRPFRVVVVGAGMSGILVAHRLRQAGIEVVVLEQSEAPGGTWHRNTYPGCRVDVPSTLYSYSFAQTAAWDHEFAPQPALAEYFVRCADELGVTPSIRYGTSVTDLAFDDADQTWTVRAAAADGSDVTERADAVVTAQGQLDRPLVPEVPGHEGFGGLSFHSARWPADLDLNGRRVAVVGTGASAAQLIPRVAEVAEHVVVYQRSPAWLLPTPGYADPIPAGERALRRVLPDLVRWQRAWAYWTIHEALRPMAAIDPDWPGGGRSVSAANEGLRAALTAYLEHEARGDEDLVAKIVPDYPPIAKRVLRDDGSLTAAWRRDDVELCTDPIAAITPTGVRTADGAERPCDVIVWATGFRASEMLAPVAVRGRDGVDLHGRWAGEPRAHLGITVPGFPNLFMMYGPNTNIVFNGSVIHLAECQARYIVDAVRLLLTGGHRTIECRPEVHDAYAAWIDEGNAAMAWSAPGVDSWYRTASGRSAQNWPYSLLQYWELTRAVDPDDHLFR